MLGTGMEVYVHGRTNKNGIIEDLYLYKGVELWVTVNLGNGVYVTTDAENIEVIE